MAEIVYMISDTSYTVTGKFFCEQLVSDAEGESCFLTTTSGRKLSFDENVIFVEYKPDYFEYGNLKNNLGLLTGRFREHRLPQVIDRLELED